MMNVDCILLSGSNVRADESSLTGEPEEMHKSPLSNEDDDVNPFIFSGCKIQDGKGEAVVCTVGPETQLAQIQQALEEETEPSPLQRKLERIANGNLSLFYLYLK